MSGRDQKRPLVIPRLQPLKLVEPERFKPSDNVFLHTGPPPVAGLMVRRSGAAVGAAAEASAPKSKLPVLHDTEAERNRPDPLRLPVLKDILLPEQSRERDLEGFLSDRGNDGDEGTNPAGKGSVNGTDFANWEKMLEGRSGEDAIAFFAKHGNSTPVKFVYCNRAQCGDEYRPYDLVVVARKNVDPEHFIISASGVVHVLPGAPSEFNTLAEWTHSSQMLNILRSIRFFKYYLITKMFQLWRRNVRFRLFAKQRKRVSNSLFMARPTFARQLTDINKALWRLDSVSLVDIKPDAQPQDNITFLNTQTAKRDQAQKQFTHIVEELAATVEGVCKTVQDRAVRYSQGLGDDSRVSRFNNPVFSAGSRMQSMFAAKNEQAERLRRLKHAKQEVDLLGDFIRLVDYMQLGKLVSRVTDTEAEFFDTLACPLPHCQDHRTATKKPLFLTTVSYGPKKLEYNPTRARLLDMTKEFSARIIEAVISVERIIELPKFTGFVPKAVVSQSRKIVDIISADVGFAATKAAVDLKINKDFDAAEEAVSGLEKFRDIYNFNDEWNNRGGLKAYMESDKHTVQSMEEDIRQKVHWMAQVDKSINTNYPAGIIMVRAQETIIMVLKPIIEKALEDMRRKLLMTFQKEAKTLETMLKAKNELLKPGHSAMALPEFARFVADYQNISDNKDEISRLYATVLSMHSLMMAQTTPIKLDVADTVVFQNINDDMEKFTALLEEAREFRNEKLQDNIRAVKKRNDNADKKLKALQDKLEEGIFVDDHAKPEDVLAQLKQLEEARDGIQDVSRQCETFQGFQRLFGTDVHQFTELPKTLEAFNNKLKLWQCFAEWRQKTRDWDKMDFVKELPVDQMNQETQAMYLTVYALNKQAKNRAVSTRLLRLIDEYKSVMPFLVRLGNKAMKPQHWQKLYKSINKPLAANAKLTLSGMRREGVFQFTQEINEVTEMAEGEYALESTLEGIDRLWARLDFIVQPYKNSKDAFILGDVEEITQHLEENQMMLQNMSASRFISAVQAEVFAWDKKLSNLSEVLEEWLVCQRNWMYLEPIFTAPDIQKQLPTEHKLFADVDRSWRIIMGKLHQHPNALKAASANGLLHTISKHNSDLEKIQKHLEEYLETKRSAFPRFYFLSNDELLAILSQTTDPQAVQPHLRKLFENISLVNFSDVPKSVEITGMVSGEKEVVPFPRSIFSKGPTEVWLNQLEDMMRESVKTVIRQTLLAYPIETRQVEEEKAGVVAAWTPCVDRKQWLTSHLAQPVLTVDQIMWTHGIEESLIRMAAGEKDALATQLEFNKSQIQGMVELIRSDLPHLLRHQVSQAIVLDVHARDVVAHMVKIGVSSRSDYEWTKQMRYYWMLNEQENNSSSPDAKQPSKSATNSTTHSILHPGNYEQYSKARATAQQPPSFSLPGPAQPTPTRQQARRPSNPSVATPNRSPSPTKPITLRQGSFTTSRRQSTNSNSNPATPLATGTPGGQNNARTKFAPSFPGVTAAAMAEDFEASTDTGKIRYPRGPGAPNDEDCYVRQTSTNFPYRYEYLGNTPRLVITPLTDKAYLTFTSALHLHYGGEASGPAGTGKTETVKDLGKALANQVIVFNCSEGLAVKMMARYFSGLAQAGAWACFDEFNRVDIEVLSVIAQQIMSIQQAVAAHKSPFEFDGRLIPLDPAFGVYITMNPGYAGRTELPDNLKALFRPVAMMVPDYAMIAEIMLYSEGFETATDMAKKMAQLYKLSSEQLSKQKHYDFGMRAVKSVLVMAGSLKREDAGTPEDLVLLRSMRDSNVPKFLAQDVPLFMGIIRDLFPRSVVPVTDRSDLVNAIEQTLDKMNCQRVPAFINKILELHETMIVRHGCMVVGETNIGKTTAYNVLAGALTLLAKQGIKGNNFKEVKQVKLNPKSVSVDELYGAVHKVTGEWKEGLVTALLADAVEDHSPARKWITFDGPVDAMWIENMNTVLDDSKLLSLANGARIFITPLISLCFEVDNLAEASPATVSRMGMVYMEPAHLGWQPLVDSWRTSHRLLSILGGGPDAEARAVWAADRVKDSFAHVLKWRKAKTLSGVQLSVMDNVDNALVQGCLALVEVFLLQGPPLEKSAISADDTRWQRLFINSLILALVWSFGANLVDQSRQSFSDFIRVELANGCVDLQPYPGSSLYELALEPKTGGFVPWSTNVPTFTYEPHVRFNSIFVPTTETTKFGYLLSTLLSINKNVLMCGETGVGKTVIVQHFMMQFSDDRDEKERKGKSNAMLEDEHEVKEDKGAEKAAKPGSASADRSAEKDGAADDAELSTAPVGTAAAKSAPVELLAGSPGLKRDYLPVVTMFSAQTTSVNLQDVFEQKFERRRKGLLCAPAGKKVVLFVDDINMPALDKYGSQAPIELLRQVIDHGGFYDRQKHKVTHVQDSLCVGACAPPGGGRSRVTPRLFRHFHMLWMPQLADASLNHIFSSILGGFLKGHTWAHNAPAPDAESMDGAPRPRAQNGIDERALPGLLVSTSVDLYKAICRRMLPTPRKSHYTFNLRDLAKVVQGFMQMPPHHLPTLDSVLQLYAHESSRVFRDRLIDNEDRQWFDLRLAGKIKESFDVAWQPAHFRDMIFADQQVPNAQIGDDDKQYQLVADMSVVKRRLDEDMAEYNLLNSGKQQMDLVLFQDAIAHLFRVARILRQPRGNALLVGVGGSGRQSLTRLSAFLLGYKLRSIDIKRDYSIDDWHDSVKSVLELAGAENVPVVFLLSDTQLMLNPVFLEDINNLLNAGEVPNLHEHDEIDAIIQRTRAAAAAAGKQMVRDAIWAHFVQTVRENLHIVLALSPVGDNFREWTRKFPALVNCCTIDWYDPWPENALRAVADRFLSDPMAGADPTSPSGGAPTAATFKIPGASPGAQEAIDAASSTSQLLAAWKGPVAELMVSMHTSVEHVSRRFLEQQGRRTYTTPTSYLELIRLYLAMLEHQRAVVSNNIIRYQTGLGRLRVTNIKVAELREELIKLQPVLVEQQAETAALLVTLEASQKVANAQAEESAADAAKTEEIASGVKAIHDDCQKELNLAMPVLEAALSALDVLKKEDITEVRTFLHPHKSVVKVLEAVCLLHNLKPSWDEAKRLLGNFNFVAMCRDVDKDKIPRATIQKLQKYIADPDFKPELLANVSTACVTLCQWVLALDTYSHVVKQVEPKRKKLEEAEVQLQAAEANLASKQASLRQVMAKVGALQEAFKRKQIEKQSLEDSMAKTKLQLERAEKLVNGLGSEETRWAEQAAKLGKELHNVVGNILLSAGCIAYQGPYTAPFRKQLTEMWNNYAIGLEIPVDSDFSLIKTISDPIMERKWTMAGLPVDQLSIENGLMVTRGRRWPLMIDPQQQANRWVKEMGKKEHLQVVKMSDGNYLRTLENAVRFGQPLLLENVEETLDAALEPVLTKQVFRKGGQWLIRLNDQDIPFSPDFKLYMTTKLRNPHYLPEISVKVTIINFTVTPAGLEEQLLNQLCQMEREDLEEKNSRLTVQVANDQKELSDIESTILRLLAESDPVAMLDDEKLINTLAHSRVTAQAITERMHETEMTVKTIVGVRESYRPVAKRASVLYFAMANMAKVDPMYHFSLQYFTKLYKKRIEVTAQAAAASASASSTSLASPTRSSAPSSTAAAGSPSAAESTPVAAAPVLQSKQEVQARLDVLISDITYSIYTNVCRALFSKDQLLFGFLLAVDMGRNAGIISEQEWQFFLAGSAHSKGDAAEAGSPDASGSVAPSWLPLDDWMDVKHGVGAAFGKTLGAAVLRDITTRPDVWQKFYLAFNASAAAAGGASGLSAVVLRVDVDGRQQILTPFQSLVMIKLLRKDKLTVAVKDFVALQLGDDFVRLPPLDVQQVYADSTPALPVVWVLSAGANPVSYINQLAEKRQFPEARVKMISLGQGQGKKAEQLMSDGRRNGDWVVLQNCHLAESFLPTLERILETTGTGDDAHQDYRLWLTSMPSSAFPVSILQNSIKVTTEPPKGLANNLMRSLLDTTEAEYESCSQPAAFKQLLFGLSFFHAVLQERRRFGSIGWNKPYDWMLSDIEVSKRQLRFFLDESAAQQRAADDASIANAVPWKTLMELVGDINYGGRVTDDKDQRCVRSLLRQYFTPAIFEADFCLAGGPNREQYRVPAPGSLQEARNYVKHLQLLEDTPEVFGLHPNADITCKLGESKMLMRAVQTATKGSSGVERSQEEKEEEGPVATPDDIVRETAQRILDELTATCRDQEGDVLALGRAHPTTFAGVEDGANTLGVFLNQEVDRLQLLIKHIYKTLSDLKQAIIGEVVMSPALEKMYSELQFNTVPELWARFAYPSLATLADWVQDLMRRIKFLSSWLLGGPPSAYWLGCFFFPQGFMTAVLQKHARATKIPIDQLGLTTHVLAEYSAAEVEPPATGAYIYGLALQGADWNQTHGLVDQPPGQLFTQMPLMWLDPSVKQNTVVGESSSAIVSYDCPVYKTSTRAGELSTTGHSTNFVLYLQLPSELHSDHWVRRGAAILLQVD